MNKVKIGLSIGKGFGLSEREMIEMLADIGYSAVSPSWYEGIDLEEICNTARSRDIILQSLHAPFQKAADMWGADSKKSDCAVEELYKSIEACRQYGIPVVVIHTWIGFEYTFGETKYGFSNFGRVVERAREYGVKVAFENTEGDEYLFALMEHFAEDGSVGFCWDSGHEMCYNRSTDLLSHFGDRLIMTHLNDNLGISSADGMLTWLDDLHLLPFDGIVDWENAADRLKKSKAQEILNLELCLTSKPGRNENDKYSRIPIRQYLAEAYENAQRIAQMYF